MPNYKKLLLKAKKQVFGEMLGNNASLFQGEGFEFTELREYVHGDDVRKIDWKTPYEVFYELSGFDARIVVQGIR